MITVSEAAEKIVKRSRYLSEAMSKGIINTSALARYIKHELEQMVGKPVSEPALIMALNRLSTSITKPPVFKNVFKTPPDMIFRSNLIEITVNNTDTLIEKYPSLLKLSDNNAKYFFTMTKGNFETTIIASKDLHDKIIDLLREETIASEFSNLSSITIRLPQEAIQTPAIFYFFLKSLAWEEVNIIEIVSAYLEFTIILEEKEVNKAFSILKSLFQKS
jgi:hypothetical protein